MRTLGAEVDDKDTTTTMMFAKVQSETKAIKTSIAVLNLASVAVRLASDTYETLTEK